MDNTIRGNDVVWIIFMIVSYFYPTLDSTPRWREDGPLLLAFYEWCSFSPELSCPYNNMLSIFFFFYILRGIRFKISIYVTVRKSVKYLQVVVNMAHARFFLTKNVPSNSVKWFTRVFLQHDRKYDC